MSAAPSPKPRRASKGRIRVWAWTAGTFSFLAPWALFGVSPRPAANAAQASHQRTPKVRQRPVVLVITKKIVIGAASAPPTTSGASVQYVYASASAPAPATVSCSTPPC